MLEELHVAGLGVIPEASLELAPGLNVLTGETGAGKTMVTVALGLALGARSAADLVRTGEPALSVEARFRVAESTRPERGPGATEGASDASGFRPVAGATALEGSVGAPGEWADEEGALVLARTVRADGRTGARANGRLVAASSLAALGRDLVEIHGQHEAQRLLDPAAQVAFLDRFAGPAHLEAVARCRSAHAALVAARSRFQALERDAREREREKDLLAYQVREIEGAGLRPGEREELAVEESRLANAERLRGLTAGAAEAVGEEGGAADGLRAAAAALRAARALDPSAGPAADRLASLAAEVDDAAGEVRAYRESLEADPERLEALRERLRTIDALERKYGDGVEEVLAFLESARARLSALEREDERREELQADAVRLHEERAALGRIVSEGRARAAPGLGRGITREVRELGMPGAEVAIELESLPEPGPAGDETVRFVWSAGPGHEPRPLARAASGGELSRAMLALRSVVADVDEVPTLVFDEIDAGIGGRAAAAVGRRLSLLAGRRQVLVVTHLAQIASHADRHFLVTKDGGTAEVRALDDADRPGELARMLSGTVTDTSLAHAAELLRAAAEDRAGVRADGDTPVSDGGAGGARDGRRGGRAHRGADLARRGRRL